MKKAWIILFGLGLLPLTAKAAQKPLRISGSPVLIPAVTRATEKYQSLHKKAPFEISSTDSQTALNDLALGKIDLALISMEIPPDIRAQFPNIHFVTLHLARDAVVPVVSQMVYVSGVKDFSMRDLKDIFIGKLKNWKELKGPNGDIRFISQKPALGTFQVFTKALFGNSNMEIRQDANQADSIREAQEAVIRSTDAITFLPMTWTRTEARGCGIKTNKGIIYPTTDAILNGTYPSAYLLSVVTLDEPQGHLKSFISFLRGPETRKIISDFRMVPYW